MLRRFAHNTAISTVAYGAAGVLGLVAVGAIAKAYGLVALGVIVLARSFLPSGFLALVDFGVSDLVTQSVVKGRAGDWTTANGKIALLSAVAATTGIISAVAVWFSAPYLAYAFKVAPDQAEAFVSIMKVTAIFLPIAFCGLIAEGILKGFEQYGWLRTTEVVSNVIYVASVYLFAWQRVSFEWVAYSYLAAVVGKYLALAIVVLLAVRQTPLRLHSWSKESRADVIHRCWLMLNNRIAGTFQMTLIPLLIGALYGPVGVGTFDLLTRLPRFLKTVMSPLYSAILPVSSQIQEMTDLRRLQILGRNGMVLPAALVVPILVVIGLFSEDILHFLAGPEHRGQGVWLAVALIVPAATITLGAGQTALMLDADFLRTNTRYLYLQVVVQYVFTALTLVWLQERAFILGWAVSFVVFSPFIARRLLLAMHLPNRLFWEQVGRQVIVAAILVIGVLAYRAYAKPEGIIQLMVAGGLSCVAAWGLSASLILSAQDRAMFGRFTKAFTTRQ